jgi:hypothetical protein
MIFNGSWALSRRHSEELVINWLRKMERPFTWPRMLNTRAFNGKNDAGIGMGLLVTNTIMNRWLDVGRGEKGKGSGSPALLKTMNLKLPE